MLRMVFVLALIIIGIFYSLQGAFYTLLFYLWNAYFRPDYWTYGGFIMSLKLSLIVGLYLVIRTIALVPSPKINLRTVLIWLFFAQCVVGCYTSENPLWSFSYLQDFVKVLLITYLLVVLINDRKQFRMVFFVMAMSLGFETAKQGWVNLIRAPGAQNANPIAFLGDNNGVAVGTMMLMPILGALAQTSKGRWERVMHRFVAIGVFMRGLTTYSRGGFLGAGALGIIWVIRSEKKFRAILTLGLLSLLVWSVMPDRFWARMDTITVEEGQVRDESSASRLHFWDVAVVMAGAKPLTGVGLNGFQKSYERYNTNDTYSSERAAHSTWYGVLGDLGYPGLILLIVNIVMAFWSCWRVTRMTRKQAEFRDLRLYANALISSLVVFCVAGSFLSAQYSEMMWHMLGMSTALHLITIKEAKNLRAVTAVRQAA